MNTTYSVDGVAQLSAVADFQDLGGGQFRYLYTLQNTSSSPIYVHWRAARNLSNPTGILTVVPPADPGVAVPRRIAARLLRQPDAGRRRLRQRRRHRRTVLDPGQ
jgi:hypothetical protein